MFQIACLASFGALAACGGSGVTSNAAANIAAAAGAGEGNPLAAYRAETIEACMTGLRQAPSPSEISQPMMQTICACTVDMHMTGKSIEDLRRPGGPSPSRNLDYCVAEAAPVPPAAPAGGSANTTN